MCVAFPFNSDNALVVDIGYQETVALPVFVSLIIFYWDFCLELISSYSIYSPISVVERVFFSMLQYFSLSYALANRWLKAC